MRKRVLLLLLLLCAVLRAGAQEFVNLTAHEVRIDSLLPVYHCNIPLGEHFADSIYTVSIDYPEFIDMSEADIRLEAHSPDGCTDTARLVIPLNKETFWIPNIFTPNDPDANYTFGAVSPGTFNQEIFIYNRYGEMVFHCLGDDCRWDGTDTHGRECVQGAYVYIIRYNDRYDPSVTKVKKGTVTLIR